MKIISFLVCMLFIVTPILSASSPENNTTTLNIKSYEVSKQTTKEITDKNPALNTESSVMIDSIEKLSAKKQIEPLSPWDVLLTIQITQSTNTAGVGADQNYIYAPEWSDSNIYYWDFDGIYQGSFTISSVSGIRDLAYDHDTGHMWGGNGGGTCWEMDFTDQTLERTITGNWQCRAIAYTEDDDMLYVSGWGDPVWLIEKDGTIADSFDLSLTTSTYGFAYDRWDEAGPLLWVHDQGGTGSEIRAYSIEEEVFIEDEWYYHDVTQEVPGGIAGGACYNEWFTGSYYTALIVNCQASTDTIVAYEFWGPPPPRRDISVKSINYPKSGYANDDLQMQTTFRNNGNNTETFDAQMTILTSNETGEILLYENFSTYGTGPNGLPEN